MLDEFCHWLSHSAVSRMVQDVPWIIPAVQTTHILSIAVLASAAAMMNVQVLRRSHGTSLPETARRYVPSILRGLLGLLATGVILIVGEPARELTNVVFWSKMGLIVVAVAVTIALARGMFRDSGGANSAAPAPVLLRLGAAVSIALWLAVITAGRWIAYTGGNA